MGGKSFQQIKDEMAGGGVRPPQPTEVVVNLNVDDVVDYANIHTYEDCETHMITLIQSRDRNAFSLGDTLCAFEVNRGRPLDQDATMSKLAGRMRVLPSQLSMWRAVALFFPDDARIYDNLRWSHYYQAMRFAAGSLDNAHETLAYADDNNLTVQEFKNYLKGLHKDTPPDDTSDDDEAPEADIALDGPVEVVLQELSSVVDRVGRVVLKGWWK